MAMVKKTILSSFVLFLLLGCDFLAGTYFNQNQTLIENSKNISDIFGSEYDTKNGLQIKLMENGQGKKHLVFLFAYGGRDRLVVVNPDNLSLENTFKEEAIVTPYPGKFRPFGDGDVSVFRTGNVTFDANFANPSTTYVSFGSIDRRLICKDSAQALDMGWLGVQGKPLDPIPANNTSTNIQLFSNTWSASVGSSSMNTALIDSSIITEPKIISSYYSDNDFNLLMTLNTSNGNTIRLFIVPKLQVSQSDWTSFKKADFQAGSNDQFTFLTRDGIIYYDSGNSSSKSRLVRKDFSGNTLDYLDFDTSDNQRVYFSKEGDFWYWLDNTRGKIYRLKTWWRS